MPSEQRLLGAGSSVYVMPLGPDYPPLFLGEAAEAWGL